MSHTLLRTCEQLARLGAIACGWAVLGLSALVGVEVIARKLFDHSLQGVDEIGGYVLAIVASLGFAYALSLRAHTRVDILVGRFGHRTQGVLNLLALASLTGLASFMLWRAYTALSESIEYGSLASTPLQTPLWLPQSVWVAGLALFALVGALYTLHAAILLVRKRPERLNQLYGPRTVRDEVDEATHQPMLKMKEAVQ